MDSFENKYGIEEDEDVKTFHRSRRMFCIYQNKLFISEPDLPYSHAVWFEKEGWISKEDDHLMDEIVRGIVDSSGDIYFYVGYDFRINDLAESLFFPHLNELAKILNLKPDAKVFGGMFRKEPGKIWPPVKGYGELRRYL